MCAACMHKRLTHNESFECSFSYTMLCHWLSSVYIWSHSEIYGTETLFYDFKTTTENEVTFYEKLLLIIKFVYGEIPY